MSSSSYSTPNKLPKFDFFIVTSKPFYSFSEQSAHEKSATTEESKKARIFFRLFFFFAPEINFN